MLKSIRILLSIAASLDLEIWQMDVKTAFLNGSLDESIYMMQPEGFIEKAKWIRGCVYYWRRSSYMEEYQAICIADSTMEAEYVAACEAAKEAVWLRQFLIDLEVVPSANKQITIYCDNSGAVANSKEPRSHKRGKHIERKYHLLREIVQRGDVTITKIASAENLADPFTKALPQKSFDGHLENMGLRDMTHLL
ncbi:hypothetical protein LWI29_009993 [Acer saccharum]|uniref:Reverse transcriptase Ty1/copia-type domain-containing protein n=1 Tax=Acer saccharum TaxID=4024 RepID=A0AA39SPW8_ACESA|nr:hypothetical protein LWI29_009993 [Acer saccharum]